MPNATDILVETLIAWDVARWQYSCPQQFGTRHAIIALEGL